jgi:D-alanyl-D-alanine carboxypeptidase
MRGRTNVVFAQNADEKASSIQSTTKVLNACTALEWIQDLESVIEVRPEEETENSYTKAGDIVTLRELFHAMMLPSCNIAANVIARVAGEKIVNTFCDKFGI